MSKPTKKSTKEKKDLKKLIKSIDELITEFNDLVQEIKNGKSEKIEELEEKYVAIRKWTIEEEHKKTLEQGFLNQICRYADIGYTINQASFRLINEEEHKNHPRYVPSSMGVKRFYDSLPKKKDIDYKGFLKRYRLVNFNEEAYSKAKNRYEQIKERLDSTTKSNGRKGISNIVASLAALLPDNKNKLETEEE